MKWLYLLATLIIAVSSCNRSSSTFLDYHPASDQVSEQNGLKYTSCYHDDYVIHMAFVEDAGLYLSFHAEVESYQKEALAINSDDFQWRSNSLVSNKSWDHTINKFSIIQQLDQEKNTVKKQKKTNTILNSLLTGIEVVAIASSGGNSANALIYAAESGAYIADERRAFKVTELFLEDEIQFIEEWVLDTMNISPYDSDGFDLLIPRSTETPEIEFMSTISDQTCTFLFEIR